MTGQRSGPDPTKTEPADSFQPALILDHSDSWWRDCAERAIAQCAASAVPFSADTLPDMGVPEPDLVQRWGALFGSARARGLIEVVGYKPSPRQTRQGGVVRVWRGIPGAVS